MARLRKEIVLGPAVVLSLSAAAWAGPSQDVVFRTLPGGATVLDDAGHIVASAPDEVESTYRFKVDTATDHTYRLKRRRFIDLSVDLHWSPTAHGWQYQCDPLSGYLEPATRFDFSRAIQLNGVPASVNVSMSTVATHARTLMVGGVSHHVVPLRQTTSGLYLVPHAYSPPVLYLDGDAVEPRAVAFKVGELDVDDTVVPNTPVELHASSTQIMRRVGLATGAGVAVIAVLGTMVLRRRRTPILPTAVSSGPVGADSLPPGTIVSTGSGEFQLGGLLGRGGMGVVYEASRIEPPDAEPCWAVKVLVGEGERTAERFQREIDICSRLQHPNIVKILDWGSMPTSRAPVPFLVMELVRGKTLRSMLRDPVSIEAVARLGNDVLRGLKAAHEMGVVHRDLKPENIMITPRGAAKIMDFGIARTAVASRLTSTQTVMGTPAYLSPEHFNAGQATPASDLFSLGIVLFEVLTNAHPWGMGDAEVQSVYVILGRLLSTPPTPLHTLRPDLSEARTAVVHKLMEADPDKRYSTASAALEDWTAVWGEGGPQAPTEPA